MNAVKVTFNIPTSPYSIESNGYYFKNEIPNLEIGQLVVVETSRGLAVARVLELLSLKKFHPGHPTRSTYGTVNKYS